jgi:Resolvase, N terminal domain
VTKERSAQKRVAIYLRVSTDEQTTENQRRELEEVATRHGWRRDVDMVAAWSVDRLGRSLIDLLDFLRELHAKGVDLFLHQQGLDTSTPSGRAMFQMLGVFAEFERAMIRERVMAGLSRARPSVYRTLAKAWAIRSVFAESAPLSRQGPGRRIQTVRLAARRMARSAVQFAKSFQNFVDSNGRFEASRRP